MRIRANTATQNQPTFKALYVNEDVIKELGPKFYKSWRNSIPEFMKAAETQDVFIEKNSKYPDNSHYNIFVLKRENEYETYGAAGGSVQTDKNGILNSLKSAVDMAEKNLQQLKNNKYMCMVIKYYSEFHN